MNTKITPPANAPRRVRQDGFTLIEMMVALAIGLVVVLGFTATFMGMKSTFNSQDKLAQLQDNERLAATILTSSLQEAGFFPDPLGTRAAQLVTGVTSPANPMVAGQYLYGSAPVTGGVAETLQTAYTSSGSELSCVGATIPAGATVRNVFTVDSTTNTLKCEAFTTQGVTTTTSGSQPLVTNVKLMSVVYAVDSSGTGNIDTYMLPAAVTQWGNVKAARITLTFINPYAAQQPGIPTINWVQTINLMNNK